MNDFRRHHGHWKPFFLGQVVSLIYRDGSTKIETFVPKDGWRHTGGPDDIIAYHQGT